MKYSKLMFFGTMADEPSNTQNIHNDLGHYQIKYKPSVNTHSAMFDANDVADPCSTNDDASSLFGEVGNDDFTNIGHFSYPLDIDKTIEMLRGLSRTSDNKALKLLLANTAANCQTWKSNAPDLNFNTDHLQSLTQKVLDNLYVNYEYQLNTKFPFHEFKEAINQLSNTSSAAEIIFPQEESEFHTDEITFKEQLLEQLSNTLLKQENELAPRQSVAGLNKSPATVSPTPLSTYCCMG
jgi:hypothetical protein